MRLSDLNRYHSITIQCHDNPDADAIASGYALYTYFKQMGKEVRFIYSGISEIQKSNLRLMLEHLKIEIEYIERVEDWVKDMPEHKLDGLLITVDCQYGAGNVTKIPAQNVAIIDHHQIEIQDVDMRDALPCEKSLVQLFRKSNLSLNELEIAGVALIRHIYNDDYHYAIIKAQPCDPNILGLISDFSG